MASSEVTAPCSCVWFNFVLVSDLISFCVSIDDNEFKTKVNNINK